MNVYDSQRIADILENMGYKPATQIKNADIILFNTCHIREKAAEKLFSDLGRVEIVKNERSLDGKETIIGVVGCVVQAENEQIAKRAPFVNFATGPLTYHRIPEILARIARDKKICIIDTDFPAESKFDFLPENHAHGGCAYLAVQEGCNNFCTYCIVPYTRGVETSRPLEDVIKEAKELVNSGVLEINLLGQNVNCYHGEDASGKERSLAYLLNCLSEIDGLKRLRYTTSYPADMTDELILCHKNLKKLMPYLHLPLQSGSDKILKAMNRRHDSKQYLQIIEKLQNANPDLRFSSDFIVGFPGETDKDFEATLNLAKQINYIQSFSFKYSRRAGTPAAVYPNQVEEKVKQQRLQILQQELFAMQLDFNQKCVGKTMPVLFESSARNKGEIFGRTPYMQTIVVKGGKENLNLIKNVTVTCGGTNSLTGTLE
ncbi:MAG: tRNA (N6-isopentenyl adenosine(37)-C2)-methylthiotransferase MiaB [Alphaproteobacteria bacterium]|nr:tRNA (N6-isopentenyl adenosine(37)-C2)-methylthiotransferase MiaB [Alphaproteobacteria bacterium]